MKAEIDVLTNYNEKELSTFCNQHNFTDIFSEAIKKTNKDLITINCTSEFVKKLFDSTQKLINFNSDTIIILKIKSFDKEISEKYGFYCLHDCHKFQATLAIANNTAGRQLISELLKHSSDIKLTKNQIKVKDWINDLEKCKFQYGYIIKEIVAELANINLRSTILFIKDYNGSIYNIKENIEKNISSFIDKENYIILTTAHISLDEFPIEEYTLFAVPGSENKKPIPVMEVLNRDSIMLESIGFVNCSDFITNYDKYGLSRTFIYPNKLANEMLKNIAIRKINNLMKGV